MSREFMNVAQIIPAVAVAVGISAAITDVTARRIPNRLTYSAIVGGLVLQAALYGWQGLLLGAGGFAYMAGVAFFATDSRLRYGHFIWHLFVLTGTGCHFFAVLGYAA